MYVHITGNTNEATESHSPKMSEAVYTPHEVLLRIDAMTLFLILQ